MHCASALVAPAERLSPTTARARLDSGISNDGQRTPYQLLRMAFLPLVPRFLLLWFLLPSGKGSRVSQSLRNRVLLPLLVLERFASAASSDFLSFAARIAATETYSNAYSSSSSSSSSWSSTPSPSFFRSLLSGLDKTTLVALAIVAFFERSKVGSLSLSLSLSLSVLYL